MPKFKPELIELFENESIPGVYGYLLQFVQIEESVQTAYENSSFSTFRYILVENIEACERLNKIVDIKNSTLIPLEQYRKKPNILPPRISSDYKTMSLTDENLIKVMDMSDNERFP